MPLQIDLTNENSLKGLWLWFSGRLSVQDIWLNPERTSYWHNFHPNFLLKLRVADIVFRLLLPSDSNLSKTTYVREKKQLNKQMITYLLIKKLINLIILVITTKIQNREMTIEAILSLVLSEALLACVI